MKICNFTITKNYKYNKDYSIVHGYNKNNRSLVRNRRWNNAGFARNTNWSARNNAGIFFRTRLRSSRIDSGIDFYWSRTWLDQLDPREYKRIPAYWSISMNKNVLIILVISFVLLITPFAMSSDINIYTKKIDPPGTSTKSTIEVYVMPIGLIKPTGTLVCTIYTVSEQTLKREKRIKVNKAINVTTIDIKDSKQFDKPICKITRDENTNLFTVFNFPTDIVRKRGTIMNPDGPLYTTYKHLLVSVNMTNDAGMNISDQQLLYSVDGYIVY